ncbi:MAG: 6,7-dimethyl-8-ribityllumazine synthase [bacterium]|nr:6,7-dimethyl-8-ribityllumazine synthase [bacterium]
MTPNIEGPLDANGIKVALLVSRFNEQITSRLLAGAEDCLERHGGAAEDRTVVRVPGAWELPQAASRLAASGRFDAIVALGCVIRGETFHFDIISLEAARGLSDTAVRHGLPVALGVLTTENVDQALARSDTSGNKGWEAALSAVEMVNLYRRLG